MTKYTKMDKAVKAKWLAALRSGNFKQGRNHLRNADNSCCCLGVLADVCGAKWTSNLDFDSYNAGQVGSNWGLHDHFMQDIKFDLSAHKLLTIMNDEGASFKSIAKWIEKHL